MIIFNESRLIFEFDDEVWNPVFQFDEDNAYRKLKDNVPESKGVDFIAIKDSIVHFIEVKNFRDARIENNSRLKTGELWMEIAQKIRDTLACLFATTLREPSYHFSPICEQLLENRQFCIWFWLETDEPNTAPRSTKDHNQEKRKGGDRSIYIRELQSKLKPWLGVSKSQVKLYQIKDFPSGQGLTVRYDAGA